MAFHRLAAALVFAAVAAAADLRIVDAVKRGDNKELQALIGKADVNAAENDGSTGLVWAVHRNNLEAAALLIRAGARVNAANELGVTPLYLACLNASSALTELLLKAGANPNATLPSGETALMTAARTGNVEVLKLLLARGVDVNAKENRRGQTALMWAAGENHPQIAAALIDRGADVNAASKSGFTALMFAAQQGNIEIARMLLDARARLEASTPEDGTPLIIATLSGHEPLATFLLDRGADPNAATAYGVTALHYAILKGLALAGGVQWDANAPYLYRPDMTGFVKTLLARGANPNARIIKPPPMPGVRKLVVVSIEGATPYLLAAASYDVELMKILVAAGADPHLVTKEKTPALTFAAGLAEGLGKPPVRTEEDDRRAFEAVKLAVSLGDSVNAANTHDVTPLHAAAYVGSDSIVEYLVKNGARMDTEDDSGQTPLSIAQQIFPPTLLDDNLRPAAIHQSTAELLIKLGSPAFVMPPDPSQH